MKALWPILALLLSYSAHSTPTRVHIIGVARTDMDFVSKLKFAEAGWYGLLDCQSFFNHLRVSKQDRDINLYLDGSDCEAWYDRLKQAGPGRPQCLDVDLDIRPVACSAP